MTEFIEIRENIKNFCSKYEYWIVSIVKFLLALSIFMLVDLRIGYMQRLQDPLLAFALALACALLPIMATLWISAILVTLHVFALSEYVGTAVFVVFAIMYLLYFRFAPKSAYNALLTPLAFFCGVPYVMPVANGLLEEPASVVPTICGVVAYYLLKGIHANEALLSEPATKENLMDKFSMILNQILGDKEMFLTIALFLVVAVVVYVIRRLSIDHAWPIAIASGLVIQFLVFFTGYTMMDLEDHSLELILGCLISSLLLIIIQFFFFDLDYTRTEQVQFEDDEYYYFVKAIPKRSISTMEKMVVKIADPDGEERKGAEEGK